MPSATLQPRSIPRQPRPVRRGSKVSPQRVLPVLLLAGFSLYGLWFVPTAWSVRSSSARQTAAVQPPPEVEAPERPAAAADPANGAAPAESAQDAAHTLSQPPVAAQVAEERAPPTHVLPEAPSECDATRTKPASAHVGSFNGVQWLELLPKEVRRLGSGLGLGLELGSVLG